MRRRSPAAEASYRGGAWTGNGNRAYAELNAHPAVARDCGRPQSSLPCLPCPSPRWAGSSRRSSKTQKRERVDSRLAAGLRAAGAELAIEMSVADAEARRLARTPAVQRAVVRADRAAARRTARTWPGLVVYAGGRRLIGAGDVDAIERTVDVLGPGQRRLGRVGVAVTLDRELLRRLQRRAGVPLRVESHNDSVGAGSLAAHDHDRRAPLPRVRHAAARSMAGSSPSYRLRRRTPSPAKRCCWSPPPVSRPSLPS